MATTTWKTNANNAASTLASLLPSTQSTLTVAAGTGSAFPSTFPFWVTLFGSTVDEGNEIALCTARTTDTLTVTRAQQGTSGAQWPIGTNVQLLWTAGAVEQIQAAITALETGTSLATLLYAQEAHIYNPGTSTIPTLLLKHSRGTAASPTATQSTNTVGQIEFDGYSSTFTYVPLAAILAKPDGQVPAAGDCPGMLEFCTTPNGAGTPGAALTLYNDKSATAGSSEIMVWDDTGRIPTAAIKTGTTNSGLMLIAGATEGSAAFGNPTVLTAINATAADTSLALLKHSRGTVASPSNSAVGDGTGIEFQFYSGGWRSGAKIQTDIDSVHTAGGAEMPSNLGIWICHDATATFPTDPVITFGQEQNVAIGSTDTALAKLEVSSVSTAFALPVLRLDQADVDMPFMDFRGTSGSAAVTSISTQAIGTYTGKIMIYINGTKYWLPYYTP